MIRHHQIRATKTCPGNVIKIEDILARVPADRGPAASTVAIKINLKLRFGQPSTLAPVLRVIPAGTTTIRIGAALTGETVGGNSNWYSDKEGNFFWAGGTDMPFPSAP